jgi:hypothetical protein
VAVAVAPNATSTSDRAAMTAISTDPLATSIGHGATSTDRLAISIDLHATLIGRPATSTDPLATSTDRLGTLIDRRVISIGHLGTTIAIAATTAGRAAAVALVNVGVSVRAVHVPGNRGIVEIG